jgi:hypothetical protein
MRELGSPYKVIEEKIQFHRKRAQYHKERADNWDRVLAQIQALQRQEQALGRVEDFKLEQPELEQVEKPEAREEADKKTKAAPTKSNLKKIKDGVKRADFARKLLLQHEADGIPPVDVRTAANAAGISTPTNYPYKIFTRMVKSGTARKDEETGRYYPVGVGKKK